MSIADGQVVLEERPDVCTRGITVDPKASVSRIGSRAFPGALEPLAPQIRCGRPCNPVMANNPPKPATIHMQQALHSPDGRAATPHRLELVQAGDARRYASDREDPVVARKEAYSQAVAAILQQPPGQPATLEEEVRAVVWLTSDVWGATWCWAVGSRRWAAPVPTTANQVTALFRCMLQVISLVALKEGLFDGVQPSAIPARVQDALAYLQERQPEVLQQICDTLQLSSKARAAIAAAFKEPASRQLTT